MLPRSMKGGLEIFLGVSSLSHGFARAFSFLRFLQEHYLTLHWKGGIEIF